MKRPRPRREPVVHDYRPGARRWGHDVAVTAVAGLQIRVTGWGSGIAVGDFVLLPNRRNASGASRYRVAEISYYSDPLDQWSAVMVHAPEEPEKIVQAATL